MNAKELNFLAKTFTTNSKPLIEKNSEKEKPFQFALILDCLKKEAKKGNFFTGFDMIEPKNFHNWGIKVENWTQTKTALEELGFKTKELSTKEYLVSWEDTK